MRFSRKLLSERVDPSHTALLVIDMQNDFVHEKGAFQGFGFDISMVREAAGEVKKILDAARKAGVLVIHTRMINDPDQNPPSWVAFWGKETLKTVTVDGSWGARFYKGFEHRRGEIVLNKYTYGAFIGTNLEAILKNHGLKTLVVVGTGPNICLGDTVHQAFALGYHVVVPREAVAPFSKLGREFTVREKEVGLYIIENHFGIVCGINDLIEVWRATLS